MIHNQHTSTKSCFNFRVRKGPSDEQSVFDLKDVLSPNEIGTFTVHDSDRTIKFSTFSSSVVCLFCNKTVSVNNKTRRCKVSVKYSEENAVFGEVSY